VTVTSGVLFGGPTPEHDISILTGLQALRELTSNGTDAIGIYWTKTGSFFRVPGDAEAESFLEGVPKGSSDLSFRVGDGGGFYVAGTKLAKDRRLEMDAVVLCTHGGPGEDGSLQAALDLAGVKYSGPTVAGAALGMDKWAFASVVAAAGLSTLPRALLDASTTSLPFEGPYILKPRFGGSSIGIDVVGDVATAKARLAANGHLARGCVVEPFRADLTDVQIALRTYPTLALSAIEKPLRRSPNAEILDYRDKYVGGDGMVSAPRELPAQLSAGQREKVEESARVIAEVASVRGVARLDFLWSPSELYVNEINTIPGSLSKYLFVDPPLSFSALLNDLIAEAIERPAHRYSVAGADGLVLRTAGSIAAKLA
jgi:D-alanine-D-alanine ligase